MDYKEEEYLQLSGLQHFRFCRRQWALIHIENLWAENLRTVDGQILHERAHDPGLREKTQFFFAAPLRSFGQNTIQFRKRLPFFSR